MFEVTTLTEDPERAGKEGAVGNKTYPIQTHAQGLLSAAVFSRAYF